MIATDSMAADSVEGRSERSMTLVLALFLGAVQIGWLGLLLWVAYQIVGAI